MLARFSGFVLGLALSTYLSACGQTQEAKKTKHSADDTSDGGEPSKRSKNKAKDSEDSSSGDDSSKKPAKESDDNKKEGDTATAGDAGDSKSGSASASGPFGGLDPLKLLNSNPQLLNSLMNDPNIAGLIKGAGGGSNPLAVLQANPDLLKQVMNSQNFSSILSSAGGLGGLSGLLSSFVSGKGSSNASKP